MSLDCEQILNIHLNALTNLTHVRYLKPGRSKDHELVHNIKQLYCEFAMKSQLLPNC